MSRRKSCPLERGTLFFAERIKQDAERFRAEMEKLDIPVTVITEEDCIPDHYKNDINGKIIAINPAILKPEYQRADRQLFLVTGGFGASAKVAISAADNVVTITRGFDVNRTGKVDVNDAQLVYDMYNGAYSDFTRVSVEKFLRADVNATKTVDATDAVAIVNQFK